MRFSRYREDGSCALSPVGSLKMFVAQVAHTQSAQATHAPARDQYALRKLVLARVAEALPIFEAETPAATLPREMLNTAYARLAGNLSREAFIEHGFAAYDAWQEVLSTRCLSPAARNALLAVDAMVAAVEDGEVANEAFGYAEGALALSQAAKAA